MKKRICVAMAASMMKKLFCSLLTCVLLVPLAGCNLEASPDITSQPSESTTIEHTQPTETATQPAEPVEPWDANDLRAMFPEPPGTIVDYGYSASVIGLTGISRADAQDYAQQLMEMGLDAYYNMGSESGEPGVPFHFWMRSMEGIVISINSYAPFDDVDGDVRIEISDYRPPERRVGQVEWSGDEYLRAIPDPGYSCMSVRTQQQAIDSGTAFEVYMATMEGAMGYEACKAYAEILLQAGFTHKQNISDYPVMDQYRFCAENAEGYMVEISRMSGGTQIYISQPGSFYPGRSWEENMGASRFLPEPECRNYIFSDNQYTFIGMDYEGAKAYAQALKDRGYLNSVQEEDDPVAKTYRFYASGSIESSAVAGVFSSRTVELIYDPSQIMEDGTPYCILII